MEKVRPASAGHFCFEMKRGYAILNLRWKFLNCEYVVKKWRLIMSIGDIGQNMLIGVISGIISSIIVTRTFMIIQSYLNEFAQIRVIALKIYRADIYLHVIVSQASKYVTYEENPNKMIREIADFNKKAIFVNKILEEVRDECFFSQYSYNTLEEYRNGVKEALINYIDDIETCSVDELGNFATRTSGLYDEYKKIDKTKKNDILKIILKDITIWIFSIGALLVSLILIA